jgi:multisubunit Na+/H+ antiporter MnhB subunit
MLVVISLARATKAPGSAAISALTEAASETMLRVGKRMGLMLLAVASWLVVLLAALVLAVMAFGNYSAMGPEDVMPRSDFVIVGVVGLVFLGIGFWALTTSIRPKTSATAQSGEEFAHRS